MSQHTNENYLYGPLLPKNVGAYEIWTGRVKKGAQPWYPEPIRHLYPYENYNLMDGATWLDDWY